MGEVQIKRRPRCGQGQRDLALGELGRADGGRLALTRGRVDLAAVPLRAAGESEVEHANATVAADHHVGRLEVAMHQTSGVGRGEPLARRPHQGQRLAPRAPLLADPVAHRDPVDVFHRHEDAVAVQADVVHGHDRGVVELRHRLRLAKQASAMPTARRAATRLAVEQLQRDPAIQLGIVGGVNGSHPTDANAFEQQVAPDHRALRQGRLHDVLGVLIRQGRQRRPRVVGQDDGLRTGRDPQLRLLAVADGGVLPCARPNPRAFWIRRDGGVLPRAGSDPRPLRFVGDGGVLSRARLDPGALPFVDDGAEFDPGALRLVDGARLDPGALVVVGGGRSRAWGPRFPGWWRRNGPFARTRLEEVGQPCRLVVPLGRR